MTEWVPIQEGKTAKFRLIPKPVAKAIYDHLYAPLNGTSQSFERLEERAGFGWDEIELMCRTLKEEEDRRNL